MLFRVLIAEHNILVREALVQMTWLCGCEPIAVRKLGHLQGALAAVNFDMLVIGCSPNDHRVAPLVYAARVQQPTLKIILGETYATEIGRAGAVDGYIAFPTSVHELKCIFQDVLNKRR